MTDLPDLCYYTVIDRNKTVPTDEVRQRTDFRPGEGISCRIQAHTAARSKRGCFQETRESGEWRKNPQVVRHPLTHAWTVPKGGRLKSGPVNFDRWLERIFYERLIPKIRLLFLSQSWRPPQPAYKAVPWKQGLHLSWTAPRIRNGNKRAVTPNMAGRKLWRPGIEKHSLPVFLNEDKIQDQENHAGL